jgi:transcriptional regulator with PAS, ATPase and Fis domain
VLVAHAWPGNLRELRHEMQRAAVISGDRSVIEPEDLSFTARDSSEPRRTEKGTLQEKIEALERAEIVRALEAHKNNRTHAAEALGLSRQGLLKKLDRYRLG